MASTDTVSLLIVLVIIYLFISFLWDDFHETNQLLSEYDNFLANNHVLEVEYGLQGFTKMFELVVPDIQVPETRQKVGVLEGLRNRFVTSELPAEGLEQCSICLEQLERRMVLKKLPCNHQFHAACINTWLAESNQDHQEIQLYCPYCRYDVFYHVLNNYQLG